MVRASVREGMSTERTVLHVLAMEGIADTDTVVAETGLEESVVAETLADLEANGLIEEDGFWYATDAGERRLDDLCRSRFDPAERDQLREVLDRFEELDDRLKELASDWQDSREVALVADLGALHADVESLFADLDDGVADAYRPYLEDLAAARTALADGEAAYFTSTGVDSYHEVWFDLHDDLLRTLGAGRHAND